MRRYPAGLLILFVLITASTLGAKEGMGQTLQSVPFDWVLAWNPGPPTSNTTPSGDTLQHLVPDEYCVMDSGGDNLLELGCTPDLSIPLNDPVLGLSVGDIVCLVMVARASLNDITVESDPSNEMCFEIVAHDQPSGQVILNVNAPVSFRVQPPAGS